MSHPAASDTLERFLAGAGEPASSGMVFRVHPAVRRDVLAASGIWILACLGTALAALHLQPSLRGAAGLLLVLIAEAAGIGVAAAASGWALGVAVRVDGEGIHRINLLFPRGGARRYRWSDLSGVAERDWPLARRAGYPPRRIWLMPQRGADEALPPLDDQRTLLELARRHVGNRPLGVQA